ncbi:MAG: glycosyl transferase, family 25 [Acidobacteriota bacterium]|nr:glycosyl transferase, family 25 [Acidobacteriota bacterium]
MEKNAIGPQRPHIVNTSRDINELLPRKVCINLDRRADRWKQMRARFDRHGIRDVRRLPAANGQSLNIPPNWSGTPGAYGCLLSHLRAVHEARKAGARSVLIFEDDVEFDTGLRDNFRNYISQVPADWDALYFGALHMEDPVEVSENVRRISRAYSTYAYALRDTIFDAFIELNGKADKEVDVNNLALQTERACYCFMPHLAWVDDDYSDAQGRRNNHWYLRESLVIRGASMEQLLGRTSLIIAYRNPARSDSVMRGLLFLARFYSKRLPGMCVVVVEQNSESTIDPASLPEGCRYLLLRDEGPLNHGLCFNAGMRISRPEDAFMIFSDSDLFMEEWDICGNLRMCQRYDCATGFGSILELTGADTLKLQLDEAMLLRWLDASKYTAREKGDEFGGYCVFNRRSIQSAGGWDERCAQEARPLSLKAERQQRVFQSPNQALRLHHD